jgi:hypothetical protein
MKIDNQVQGTTPGTLLSVSVQVKQEAARWREAASANRWAVLTVPAQLKWHDDHSRQASGHQPLHHLPSN